MNALAISHQGRGIDCFPLDAHTFRVRFSAAKGDFERVRLCYALNKYCWGTERTLCDMTLWGSDEARDYYTCDLNGADTRLAYVFQLEAGGETWYFSEDGLTRDYDFERGYDSFFEYPYIHEYDVHRVVSWADTAVMYQIFPERFANGMGEKPYVNTPWDAEPTPTSYLGGDLPGIEQHLPYLSDLGVNCLYLTPIHPSPSNHKYIIDDYLDVDAAFGGRAAFRSLVNAAHARGIRVMLDGVFNHCSMAFPPFADVRKRGKASPYWDWFFVDGEYPDPRKGNYLTFAACRDMPKLNTGNPDVIRYFCDIGVRWIQDFDIDGWRLDVMDETSQAFLRAFRQAVKAAKPDALILGETWHTPRAWLSGDQMDGVMNYGLTKALKDYLVNRTLDAPAMAGRLTRLYLRTPAPAARMMMNLIGSHDTHRFLTLLEGDVARLKLAYCVLFFYVGMPCVYYGDEVSMEGGYDPGCRRGFPWDQRKWNADLRKLVKSLCRLRAEGCLAGDEMSIASEGGALILTRPGATLLVNAGDSRVSLVHQGAHLRLAPVSYRILKHDAPPTTQSTRRKPQ